jgi:AcrR family transcriptional regulator
MNAPRDGAPADGAPETDAVPEPAWRRRAAEGPRLPLTRAAIIEAAMRILDREGIDGLSMRRVAEELGTGQASIYWHVRNKAELLQLLYERATEEVVLPEPDPSRWAEQLEDFAAQLRTINRRHRDIARISLGRIPSGPTIARITEWLFQLMTPVGVPDRVVAYFCDLLGLYVGAFTFEESLGLASPTGEDLTPDESLAMLRDYMLSLPADHFPHVHRASGHLFDSDIEARFDFGVDIIVRGLRSYATAGPAPHDDAGGPGS